MVDYSDQQAKEETRKIDNNSNSFGFRQNQTNSGIKIEFSTPEHIQKRKRSGYNFYMRDKRREILTQNPEIKSVEVMKLVAEMWKNADYTEKEIYQFKSKIFNLISEFFPNSNRNELSTDKIVKIVEGQVLPDS